MESTVFTTIGTTVANAIAALVEPAAGRLIASLQALTLAMVTLYILLMGFAIVTGKVQAPASRVLTQWGKIVIISSIALSIDSYAFWVIDTFQQFEVGMANALSLGGIEPSNIYTVLDNTLNRGIALAALCLQNADDAGWNLGSVFGWWLAMLVVSAGTVIVAVIGGAIIIVAKLVLAILFSLGPFFVILLMFPITARFFDAWFSQVMNYTLLIVIISMIMAFAMVLFNAFITGADLSGSGEVNPLLVSAEMFILSYVLVFILHEARSISASMGGGLSMSALGLAHILTPARNLGNAANPQVTRRDMQSGMQSRTSRANHLIAGNTPANPAYLQNVKSNMGKNWGRWKGGKVSK